MVLDGFCYLVILFCRVILSRMSSYLVSDEYPCSTYKYFRLRTSIDVLCVSPDATLINDMFFIISLKDP